MRIFVAAGRCVDHFVQQMARAVVMSRERSSTSSHDNGRQILVGYVGIMGRPEGIDLGSESVRHLVKDRSS